MSSASQRRLADSVQLVIAEDDKILAMDLEARLKRLGYHVLAIAASGEEAVHQAQELVPDLALIDIGLQGQMNGIQAAEQIRRAGIRVILTATSDEDALRRARVPEPFGYILKPFDDDELRTGIEISLYRHAAGQQLAAGDEPFRLVSEMVSDFAYALRVEPGGTLVCEWTSPMPYPVPGLPFDQLVEQGRWTDLVYPDDLPLASRHLQVCLDGQPDVAEYRVGTPGGQVRWVRDYARPIWDEAEGRVVRIYGAGQDITERVQAREAERRIKLELDQIFRALPDLYFRMKRDGTILDYKAGRSADLYTPPERFLGQRMQSVLPPGPGRLFESAMQDLARGAPQVTIEYVLPLPGGDKTFEARLLPLQEDQMVVVVRDVTDRYKAEEELRAQKRLFENLVAVARATADRSMLDITLRNVLEVSVALTGAADADLILLDDAGIITRTIVLHDERTVGLPQDMATRVMKDGLAGWVARNRQGVLLTDTLADPRWLVYTEAPYEVRSALSVPILSSSVLVGVLTLLHPQPAHFVLEHLELMQAAADQLALALRNAQMFEAQRRMVDRQHTLYEILRGVSGQLDLDRVAHLAVEAIARFTGWADVCIALPDEQELNWVIRASSGNLAGAAGLMRPMRQGVIGRAWRTGQTQTVPDVAADLDYIAGHPDIRSEIAIPLRRGERLLGVLDIGAEQLGAFAGDEALLAESLADAVSLALDNARLYEAAQGELQERRGAEAALRERAAELKARNEELDAFAHTVAHDLKNPLHLIIGFAEELENDYAFLSQEQLRASLHTIVQSGRKLNNITDELLLLAGVRKESVEIHPLPMASIVAEALLRLDDAIRTSQAHVEWPDTWPPALGHAPWIEEVWTNYLSNAIKYGGRPPRIQLGAEPQPDGMVRFWVLDNGRGIAAEARADLFTQLSGVRANGHGLGLSIVRRIVEKLGGQVGVESAGEPERGSRFYFTLPPVPAEGQPAAISLS